MAEDSPSTESDVAASREPTAAGVLGMDAVRPSLVIEPPRAWASLGLGELWAYRELLFFLAWRDVTVRYKQAVLGVAWAVIQPVMTMVVFSVVFGRLAKLPSEGLPYPLFTFSALLPWQLFAGSVQRAGMSLVGNAGLLTKIYFPRLVMPIASVIAGLPDFAISLVVLVGLMFYFGAPVTAAVVWVPAYALLALLVALAVSLWLSALNVLYRDVQQLIPFLLQFWMYASPVAYSASLIPSGRWRFVYGLNPMAGVIQGFRWALLGAAPPSAMLLASTSVVLALLVSGLYYFRRMERMFADVV